MFSVAGTVCNLKFDCTRIGVKMASKMNQMLALMRSITKERGATTYESSSRTGECSLLPLDCRRDS